MSSSHIQIDIERVVHLTPLSINTAYTLLGTARMRRCLYLLSRCESVLSLERLARAVTQLVGEIPLSSARVSLVHSTLPRLEDYGVLDYELQANSLHLDGPVVGLSDPLGTVVGTSPSSELPILGR